MMTLEQSKGLKEAFDQAADANGYISWLKCMQIAKDLGLEYEQVCVDVLVLHLKCLSHGCMSAHIRDMLALHAYQGATGGRGGGR